MGLVRQVHGAWAVGTWMSTDAPEESLRALMTFRVLRGLFTVLATAVKQLLLALPITFVDKACA
ncbi:MAG: hypothetical protein ACK55B_10310 [Cyanobacteriota bacterium]